jgi:hypothetical protein
MLRQIHKPIGALVNRLGRWSLVQQRSLRRRLLLLLLLLLAVVSLMVLMGMQVLAAAAAAAGGGQKLPFWRGALEEVYAVGIKTTLPLRWLVG